MEHNERADFAALFERTYHTQIKARMQAHFDRRPLIVDNPFGFGLPVARVWDTADELAASHVANMQTGSHLIATHPESLDNVLAHIDDNLAGDVDGPSGAAAAMCVLGFVCFVLGGAVVTLLS